MKAKFEMTSHVSKIILFFTKELFDKKISTKEY